MTLTDFLLARIAEDEAYRVTRYREGRLPTPRELREADRWQAECEAKRQIVEEFEEERVRRNIYNKGYDDGLLTTNDDLRQRLASNAHCRGLEIAMEAHASVYADHPDYREEWKP